MTAGGGEVSMCIFMMAGAGGTFVGSETTSKESASV